MARCAHTMRVGQGDKSVRCGDCGKLLQKAPKLKTFTVRGVAAHRLLRAFDPTFPLHPDDPAARDAPNRRSLPATTGEAAALARGDQAGPATLAERH